MAQLTERGSPEQVLFWPQVLAEMRDQYEGPFVKGPLSQRGEKGKIQVAGSKRLADNSAQPGSPFPSCLRAGLSAFRVQMNLFLLTRKSELSGHGRGHRSPP